MADIFAAVEQPLAIEHTIYIGGSHEFDAGVLEPEPLGRPHSSQHLSLDEAGATIASKQFVGGVDTIGDKRAAAAAAVVFVQ